MGSRKLAVKVRGHTEKRKNRKMSKKRNPSGDGDCVSESSGYHSSTEVPLTGSEDVLTRREALQILSISQMSGHPVIPCENSVRGCPVKSYPKVLGIHSQSCLFKEIRKLCVRGWLHLQAAAASKFRPFCSSFEATRKVVFLFKLTKERDSVKICAQHYTKEHTYTLTFYDKNDRHIHKIPNSKTGLAIHIVPAKVFAELGNSVKYKIQMMK